jgi:biopolymer transport protein ExbB
MKHDGFLWDNQETSAVRQIRAGSHVCGNWGPTNQRHDLALFVIGRSDKLSEGVGAARVKTGRDLCREIGGRLKGKRTWPGGSQSMVSRYRRWVAIVAVLWPAIVVWIALLAGPGLLAVVQTRAWAQETSSVTSARTGRSPAVTGEDEGKETGSGSVESRPGVPRVDARESFLVWMARVSGPIGVVIAAMSFYLFALVVWMALRYRTPIAMPRPLVHELQELLDQKKYSEAYHRLIADSSLLARVLAAGVRKLPSGLPHAQRAMELANEDATMEMEHRTTYLATVGTLGPMIGLVGTVYGMIMAFRVIALEGSSPQASQLAAGISTALFATLEGIAISIPAIYFYSMFRNRIARLSLEVAMGAEPLLEQFAPGVRTQEPAPVQPQPPMPMPMPMGGPTSHPHPFAVSAALAAASGGAPPRSALPPAEPE